MIMLSQNAAGQMRYIFKDSAKFEVLKHEALLALSAQPHLLLMQLVQSYVSCHRHSFCFQPPLLISQDILNSYGVLQRMNNSIPSVEFLIELRCLPSLNQPSNSLVFNEIRSKIISCQAWVFLVIACFGN